MPSAATFILRVILPVLALFFSGCATHKTRAGRETTILGGLAEVKTASYAKPPVTSADVDTTKLVGFGNPSGTEVSILWGLFHFHDY